MCSIESYCYPVVIPDDYARNIDQAREKLNTAFSNDFLKNKYPYFEPYYLKNEKELSTRKRSIEQTGKPNFLENSSTSGSNSFFFF